MCNSITCARNPNPEAALEMWVTYIIEQAAYSEPGDRDLDRVGELESDEKLFDDTAAEMKEDGIDVVALATGIARGVFTNEQVASMLDLEVADINTAIGLMLENAGIEPLAVEDITAEMNGESVPCVCAAA